MNPDLFLNAQEKQYDRALIEICNGKKESHWMWYIFPQLNGLGRSELSRKYSLNNLKEAQIYLQHPILGTRLTEISSALMQHQDKSVELIFGFPDYLKLQSCMTLFSEIEKSPIIFDVVLKQFYNGEKDLNTLKLLKII